MKKDGDRTMALCDAETDYAQAMMEFLKKNKNLPWEPHMYTNPEDLLRGEKDVCQGDSGPSPQTSGNFERERENAVGKRGLY